MQAVVCPVCSMELGESEDEGDPGLICDCCGAVFDVEPVEDLTEMYGQREEAERDRWIPDRKPH